MPTLRFSMGRHYTGSARLRSVPSSSRVPRGLRPTALALVAGAFLFRLALLRRHAFNPDEFQHLHGAWSIARGLLPYRDYFEHHTPWLHFFLAPFLAFFAVDTDPGSAEAFLFFARGWMWVFSGLALALTFWLGKLWDGEATGWAGAALLSTTVMFLDKTLEVRPDVPAVVFLLGSWVALLLALRREAEGRAASALFAQGGLLLGTALLCTQKALFVLPASAVWMALYLLDARGAAPRTRRVRSVLWHAGGALAPFLIVLALFALRGGLGAFVDSNFVVNLRWPVRFSPEPLLRQLLHENGLLVVLGLAGLGLALLDLARGAGPRAARMLVPLHAIGLGAGVWVIPVPYAQYLVLGLPLLALAAGGFLARAAAASRPARRPARMAGLAAIGVVVLAASMRPVRIIAGMRRPPHTKVEDHLRRLRHVLQATRPDETILDGFSGLGVFRPHAYFHFFLHDEIRVLLGERGTTRLLSGLRDGAVAPDWVIADADVLALPAELVAFLRASYEPTGSASLWRVKRDLWLDDGRWLDLGSLPTDVLAGRGWYAPETEGERTFRQGRGPRSSARLPVRRPARCRRIVVRARPEYTAAMATVELAVNGRAVGGIRLQPGWREYPVPLPRAVLRRGINALQLSYRPVPSEADPGHRGRDALAAVDGIRLECGRPR
jgi:hypothetical protein